MKEVKQRFEQYGSGWPPANAVEFIAWCHERLAEIPEEYRETATIEIDNFASYGDSVYAAIDVTYYRPETAEEIRAREAKEKANEAAVRANELRMLKELSEKYGKGG